jgi:Cu/Ag efflux pump CusA
MLAGLEVGSLFEQQKVFQVVVWSTPESRSSLSSIKNLLIDTPTGGHVRLEDVANVRISPTPTVIERDEVSRRIDIGLNARGRDPGAIASEINHKLAATRMPLEYHAEVISTYQSSETLHRRMFASGLAVLIGIFLLLQAAFASWRLAALFTLTLPVSLSGGVLLAFLFRTDMTLATLAGFIAVLAIAVRGGIAVLTRAGALVAEDGRRTPATAVVEAAGERLGPLVTAALATMLALVPLMVTGSIPGQELAQPIAIVVFGGLITTTLVTAFLVPAIYAAGRPRREAEPRPTTEPATT